MENELIKLAATQGIWAALSLVLIFYILKKQEQTEAIQADREKNYQNIISQLTSKLEVLDNISADLQLLKNNLKN